MAKRHYITKRQFNKIDSKVNELFELLFVAQCFADNYLADIYEVKCIVPLLKTVEKISDELVCMMLYIRTKDEELKDLFR